VTSRVDYCNALYAGRGKRWPISYLRVLNAAVHVQVSNTLKFDRCLTIHSCTMSAIGSTWTYTRESHIQAWRWDVRLPLHAWPGTSVPRRPCHSCRILSRLLASSAFCKPTSACSKYLVVHITCCRPVFQLLVRRSGTLPDELRDMACGFDSLNSFSKQSCLVFTGDQRRTGFLNEVRRINSRFTYLFTYLT